MFSSAKSKFLWFLKPRRSVQGVSKKFLYHEIKGRSSVDSLFRKKTFMVFLDKKLNATEEKSLYDVMNEKRLEIERDLHNTKLVSQSGFRKFLRRITFQAYRVIVVASTDDVIVEKTPHVFSNDKTGDGIFFYLINEATKTITTELRWSLTLKRESNILKMNEMIRAYFPDATIIYQ